MEQMKRSLVLVLVGLAVLLLAACGRSEEPVSAAPDEEAPAVVEAIEGSEFNRVVLTAKAAERLGIETTPIVVVAVGETQTQRAAIPYSAVVYGLHGETWTYTNPEPLIFVRHPVTVETVEGGQALLSDGPPVGTAVVTTGAQMLYGADTGVGK